MKEAWRGAEKRDKDKAGEDQGLEYTMVNSSKQRSVTIQIASYKDHSGYMRINLKIICQLCFNKKIKNTHTHTHTIEVKNEENRFEGRGGESRGRYVKCPGKR